MLKRLYINNFRCLVNFEINFGNLSLLMGPSGGGKSTLFELVDRVRRLVVDNTKVKEVFPVEDLPAWMDKSKTIEQTFEFDVQGEKGLYQYKLVILHNPEGREQHVELEQLLFESRPLFEFKQGEVNLLQYEHEPGQSYTYDWNFSVMTTIFPRNDNQKLSWFKQWFESLFIVTLQPQLMTSESAGESNRLNRSGANFASWYRYISQEQQDKTFKLISILRETIPGFYAFRLEQAGKYRMLKVGFTGDEKDSSPVFFDFEQLSDGQRVLIVLYTLLFGLQHPGQTIFLDEPENNVALPEIQPWLMELNDACGDGLLQAVLISHHPELIDYLGPECGKWIERDPLGPSRLKTLPAQIEKGLKLSEQIARGWTE
jgi:predicted ATPase